MHINPEEILRQGSELLKPLFSGHGFALVPLSKGKSSGGQFASAEFRRGDRSLEVHFRFSLGMVTYRLGSESMSHEEYMCSVLGKPHQSHYPGFSKDLLDAFRDLHYDVRNWGQEFLKGTDDRLLSRMKDARVRWLTRLKLPE